ncbi:hypothetical protein BKA62DRAFT_706914 [Auriculariales sp. MPI-PUGE-AT-0066]|nr:hypothetical protein BKA62DRAFT_706914 [Auriculariales sp. MPI-PUGE-AT-0066]
MRVLAWPALLATFTVASAAGSLVARQNISDEQQTCIQTCATKGATAHRADATSCTNGNQGLTQTIACLCTKKDLWAAIDTCVNQACAEISTVLDTLCAAGSDYDASAEHGTSPQPTPAAGTGSSDAGSSSPVGPAINVGTTPSGVTGMAVSIPAPVGVAIGAGVMAVVALL